MNNKMDSKKFWVYTSCAIIVLITIVAIVAVIVTDTSKACEHEYTILEQVDPTYDSDGKIVKKCNKCEQEKTETLAKLERAVIKFNGLELTFGEYSFAEVDNVFSEYDKQVVVKIPVTVKNVSQSPNYLNVFYYTLFGSSGAESPNVGYLFDDDMSEAGELLSEKSYTKYLHILYDGDGVYTIVLDDLLFDKETIEIYVTK